MLIFPFVISHEDKMTLGLQAKAAVFYCTFVGMGSKMAKERVNFFTLLSELGLPQVSVTVWGKEFFHPKSSG